MKLDPGKLVVIGICTLALVLASVAWGWNYLRTDQSMAFYGSPAALMIRTAKTVQLVELDPAGQPLRTVDLSKAKGMEHARHSLLSDASYEWTIAPQGTTYAYQLKFTDGTQTVTIAIDPSSKQMRFVEQDKQVAITTKSSTGWHDFATRKLEENK